MPRESQADRKKRAAKILRILRKEYPDATTALNWKNPLQLLVAVILSAQCTDKRVNIVTKDLFKKYRTAADYARAEPSALENEIRSTGFFRNKARSLRNMAAQLVERHDGEVPDDMDALLALPGVARKTANVVLGTAFGRNEGVVVDTHVQRLANRLKLTTHETNAGDKIEKDLMELIPRKDWTFFAHALIHHGRAVCTARKPDCAACPLQKPCPSAFKV